MLDFFRNVAQTIPASLPSGSTSPDAELADAMQGSARDMLQDRAGIIVLREDLDFYVIPPRPEIGHDEMLEVKRAAGRSLLKQDGIFSGLRKSEEIGSTEQHLIEMLTAGLVPPRMFKQKQTLTCGLVDSIARTNGVTVPRSPTRLLFAVLPWPNSALMYVVTCPTTMPLAWLRNCSCSGESPPAAAGGKALS
jgi:hypothetical protein